LGITVLLLSRSLTIKKPSLLERRAELIKNLLLVLAMFLR
jgi:hypothetical protein